jgi:methylated-DNA-[protein]-cysteine S-methyltransferase
MVEVEYRKNGGQGGHRASTSAAGDPSTRRVLPQFPMSEALGFQIFETPIGGVGIAWSDAGVAGVFLPEANATATRRRILRRFGGARELTPPAEIRCAVDAITALLRGERADLSRVALDLHGVPDLNRRVYEIARTIAPGRTLTYGEIAERLGDTRLARDVGRALARNPFSIVVPCHRVLAANGKLGGFSARGGVETKQRLLSIEGVQLPGTLPLFASLYGGRP